MDFEKDSIKPEKILCRAYLFGKYPEKQTITFCFTHKKPNAWHRFWQKLLLGWEWEDEKK
jgi:hypothetical protein